MSMLSIDCFEQRSLRLLKTKLQALSQSKQLTCDVCNKLKKFQNNVLINYDIAEIYKKDIVYVCGKCIQSRPILKNEPNLALKQIITVLGILTQKDMRSLSRQVLKKIIVNIKGMQHIRKHKKEELVELVIDSLDGFDQQYQQYVLEYQNLNIKACDQIREFYHDITTSKIVNYYNFASQECLRFDQPFQNHLQDYVHKQINFKLQILKDMETLTKQVRESDHLFHSLKKMMKAMDQYGIGFQKTKDLQKNVVYSISRTAIQHKHVEGYYQTTQVAVRQKAPRQLVKMETPFGSNQIIFKISITSLMEYVELGVYLVKKTNSFDKILRPLLIRLQVRSDECPVEQATSKKQERQILTRKSKMMGISHIQDKSWQLSEQSSLESEECMFQINSRQNKNKNEEFRILSGDQISMVYDRERQKLIIENVSTSSRLLCKDLSKIGRMIIYPCVRLVSYNCKVERIIQQ